MSLLKQNFGFIADGQPIDIFTISNNNGIQFSITNYGGRVTSLSVPDKNELKITYKAVTEKSTLVNLTYHGYLNLSGNFSRTILDHELKLNSDKILESNQESIPTGKVIPLNSTPFEFYEFEAIGKRINCSDNRLKNGDGYDHTFIFEKNNSLDLAKIKELKTV